MSKIQDVISKAIPQSVKNWWFPVVGNTPIHDGMEHKQGAKDISSYIAPVQFTRTTTDVSTWREAINEAERQILPFRTAMQRIYADTFLNGQTYAAIQKRKNLSLLKEYALFNPDGSENEEATKLINDEWFSLLMNYCLDAQYFGYTLVGLGDYKENGFPDLRLIKRENVSPDRLCVAPIVGSPQGWVYFMNPESKDEQGNAFMDWTVYVETPSETGQSRCGYGLLYKVALYEIFLKNNLADNATNNELFTQPYRQFKTDKTSPEEVAFAERQMQNMGAKAYAITGMNDEIKFIDTSAGGQGYKTYESLELRLMKMISKVIFGNSDVMDPTPGKLGNGQGEESPVKQALEDVEVTDNKFFTNIANKQILPKLRKIGLKIPEDVKFGFKNNKEEQEEQEHRNESNGKIATWVKSLSDSGYEVDINELQEIMGMKLVKKAEPKEPKFPKEIKNKLNRLYEGL